MKRRMVTAACLLLTCSVVMCSCGAQSERQSGRVLEEVQEAQEKTIPVTDCAGRLVDVPEKSDSVACLYAYAGHACVMLGCEERISAVVDGIKRDRLMQEKIEHLDDMPCPYTSGSINIEELAAVHPDLILLRKENIADAGELQKLDRIGIPYVVIDYVTMEEQKESIRVMGEALGCEERAQAYLQYYENTVSLVRERLSKLSDEEKIRVFHSVNEAVRTDIRNTLSYEVLDIAGCRNVADSSEKLRFDGGKAFATVEQIYAWDPDVILANEPDAAEYFRSDSKFAGLRAVRENAVYQLPVGISRWAHPGSIESPLAALYVAKLFYPQYFEDIDMEKEIEEFYRTYFDIQLTETDIAQILSGHGMRAERQS
ncbi:MAG: ABC transporter substrate-binding protein [Clostridium sp.]|nr:ABC transporter substrate-binding protein [Clostridium sp.]